MMNKCVIYIIGIFLFFYFCGFSQEYNYRHYDIRDGLAGLTVYSAVQDKDGFMWFATETGLSRFDGAHFKNFTTADGLPDNEIIKLYVDEENRIWILPFAQAICYYWHGKLFTRENDSILSKIKFKSEPVGVVEDREGNIMISENNALHILSTNGDIKTIKNFDIYDFTVLNIGLSDQNFIVCATVKGHGCLIFQIKNNELLVIGEIKGWNTRTTIILNNSLRGFSNQDNLINVFNKENDEIVVPRPLNFVGLSVLSDSEFTINTIDSVYIFSVLQNKIIHKFYIGKPVNNCIKDNEDNYWFVTTGYGIYKLGSTVFYNYSFIYGNNPLPVYSIYIDEDSILAGTGKSSIWKINLSDQKIALQNSLTDYLQSRITCITENDRNKLYFGSDNGLIYFDNKRPNYLFRGQAIKCISFADSNFIVSTNRAVYGIRSSDSQRQDTIWQGRATCAYKFDNIFFVGTLTGLYLVDDNKKIMYAGEKEPLLKSRISAMAQSPDGVVWIATYGNGIVGYKNGKIIKHITQEGGLTSNMCRVIALNNKEIWTGTDKGINKIDINNDSCLITAYTSKDGLNCDIINCMLIENDTVYAGTPYGLTVFNPKEINNNSVCNLVITSFQSEKNRSDTALENISFPPGDHSFRIEFTAISFKSEGNISYYYKLSGIDTGWQTTRQNIIEYATLAPGNYTLQLYAINAFGKKSGTKAISFTIKKYFYQQNLFIIFSIAVIVAFTWFILRHRIALIRKEGDEKLQTQNRIAELEQMALRAQMNPHFIFNCLNSIQQYIFEKDSLEANIFITSFASLIRQTLDISTKKFITLQQEIKYLGTYLGIEQTRFENSFDFTVETDSSILPEEIYIPPLLLQPFVENSIRHGIRNLKEKKGKVTVKFYREDRKIYCIMEDNGIGREAAQKFKDVNFMEYQSKGMLLTQQRIDSINTFGSKKIIIKIEDLKIDGIAAGTRVTLQFFDDDFQ